LYLITIYYTVGAKNRSKFESYKKRILSIIESRTNFHDFTVDIFIIYNLKTGGAYTKSILQLQNSIKSTFLGHSFWLSTREKFKYTCHHIDQSLSLFQQLQQNIHRQLQSLEGIREAQEEIKKFIRIVSDFLDFSSQYKLNELINDTSHESNFIETYLHPSIEIVKRVLLRQRIKVSNEPTISQTLLRDGDLFSLSQEHVVVVDKNDNDTLMLNANVAKQYALQVCKTSIEDIEKHMQIK
jgi:hypothetical protein